MGGQNVRFECPACHEAEGFSLNLKTGLWLCHRASCGEKGNLYQLKILMGDALQVSRPAQPVASDLVRQLAVSTRRQSVPDEPDPEPVQPATPSAASAAATYLESRHISQAAAKLAKLGWRAANRCPSGQLCIPYPGLRVRTNGVWEDLPGGPMVKFRVIPPEPVTPEGNLLRYLHRKGGAKRLYAPCGITAHEPLLIVGGEIDVLSVLSAALDSGLDRFNVCCPPSENTWADDWTELLAPFEDIVVALDADAGGKKATAKLTETLGRHRCRIGTWPAGCSDANDARKSGELEDLFALEALMASSKPAAGDGVRTPAELADAVIARLYGQEGAATGRPTGWKGLDEKLGGWRGGEVSLLTGETGGGKSTFASQAGLNQLTMGHRVLMWPAEIGAIAAALKLVRQSTGIPPHALGEAATREALQDISLGTWLVDRHGRTSETVVGETLLYVVARLGVTFVIIDHIDWLAGTGDDQWDRRSLITEASIHAIRSGGSAHLLLIAHPEKSKRGNRIVQPWEVKGKSDFIQAMDNGMSIHRPRPDDPDEIDALSKATQADAGLYLWKVRDAHGVSPAFIDLTFDRTSERYADA